MNLAASKLTAFASAILASLSLNTRAASVSDGWDESTPAVGGGGPMSSSSLEVDE